MITNQTFLHIIYDVRYATMILYHINKNNVKKKKGTIPIFHNQMIPQKKTKAAPLRSRLAIAYPLRLVFNIMLAEIGRFVNNILVERT